MAKAISMANPCLPQVGVILYILMTGEMPWSSMVSLEAGPVPSCFHGNPRRLCG